MTLMRCYVIVLCLAFTPKPHAVWTSQGGKGKVREFMGLRTSCLQHPLRHHFSTSIHSNQSQFGNNDNYFPAPQPQDSDSVGLGVCLF